MMTLAQSHEAIKIIGIDPGYDRVGWCVGEHRGGQTKIVQFGSIVTEKSLPLFQRYWQVSTELAKVLDDLRPTEASVESLFFATNAKTAIHVAEARGVIIATLMDRGVAVFEYTPLQMKQAVTGFGKADKGAVDRMLRLQFHLGDQKILDDTMDAVGMMMTHAVSRQITSFALQTRTHSR